MNVTSPAGADSPNGKGILRYTDNINTTDDFTIFYIDDKRILYTADFNGINTFFFVAGNDTLNFDTFFPTPAIISNNISKYDTKKKLFGNSYYNFWWYWTLDACSRCIKNQKCNGGLY
jgi:hypothetical protein